MDFGKACHITILLTQLPAYDIAKERIKLMGLEEVPLNSLILCPVVLSSTFLFQGPRLHLIASLMAGLAAALASNPVRPKCFHDI